MGHPCIHYIHQTFHTPLIQPPQTLHLLPSPAHPPTIIFLLPTSFSTCVWHLLPQTLKQARSLKKFFIRSLFSIMPSSPNFFHTNVLILCICTSILSFFPICTLSKSFTFLNFIPAFILPTCSIIRCFTTSYFGFPTHRSSYKVCSSSLPKIHPTPLPKRSYH